MGNSYEVSLCKEDIELIKKFRHASSAAFKVIIVPAFIVGIIIITATVGMYSEGRIVGETLAYILLIAIPIFIIIVIIAYLIFLRIKFGRAVFLNEAELIRKLINQILSKEQEHGWDQADCIKDRKKKFYEVYINGIAKKAIFFSPNSEETGVIVLKVNFSDISRIRITELEPRVLSNDMKWFSFAKTGGLIAGIPGAIYGTLIDEIRSLAILSFTRKSVDFKFAFSFELSAGIVIPFTVEKTSVEVGSMFEKQAEFILSEINKCLCVLNNHFSETLSLPTQEETKIEK